MNGAVTVEPPRQVGHFALLIAAAFTLIISAFASGRPMALGGFNNVAVVGSPPAGMRFAWAEDWSVVIHRSDWNPAIAKALGRTGEGQGPRLGWIIREWSFFSLPLFAWRQSDLSLVKEDAYGYQLSALTDEERRTIEQRGGPGLFPFWRYCWGLLVPLAVAAAIAMEFRWQARRRAMLGLI